MYQNEKCKTKITKHASSKDMHQEKYFKTNTTIYMTSEIARKKTMEESKQK